MASAKWEEAKAKRKQRRDVLRDQGKLKQQSRNPRGFIVKNVVIDGQPHEHLEPDTKKAHQDATYQTMTSYDEQPAIALEKRKAKQKRAAKKRNERKPGEVRVTRKQAKKK